VLARRFAGLLGKILILNRFTVSCKMVIKMVGVCGIRSELNDYPTDWVEDVNFENAKKALDRYNLSNFSTKCPSGPIFVMGESKSSMTNEVGIYLKRKFEK